MFKMNTFLNRDLLNVLKRRLNAMDKHGMQTGRTLSIACHRPVGQPERSSWMKNRFQIYYSEYELLTKFCTYVCKILCLCFLVSIPLSVNACGGQRATLGVMPGSLHIIFRDQVFNKIVEHQFNQTGYSASSSDLCFGETFFLPSAMIRGHHAMK